MKSKKWVVNSTYPTIDTSLIETYLARYINRVAISNSRITYIKETEEVQIEYNDYRSQKDGQAAPKAYKHLDPLTTINQIMQHVLPSSFQKTRRYGIHSIGTKRKIKESIPEALKRTVRTVLEILTQLLKETPYRCEVCKSTDHTIISVKPDKIWMHKYIHVPKISKTTTHEEKCNVR